MMDNIDDARLKESTEDVTSDVACAVQQIRRIEEKQNDATKEDTEDDVQRLQGGIDSKVIENLALGVLEKLQPQLQHSKKMLEELTENQRILIETIHQENKKFTECQAYKDVSETMEKAKMYHGKLINIKKEMFMLHDKSAKLKKRALRIQQQKNKEVLEREQNREAEIERERMLIAKPAKPVPAPNPPT